MNDKNAYKKVLSCSGMPKPCRIANSQLPGLTLTIVVFDMPAGEIVVNSLMVFPTHPTCAMTVSLMKTPELKNIIN